ncbi:hypothetical protein ACLOJK_012756 [Asimina triloba]
MGDAVDLTGDGGVMKKIVRRAKPDAPAPTESLPLVDVHYEGVLAETGEVFDSTHEDNTVFSFEIGKGTVIKAWDIAVKTMKVGEVTQITCKPEYAYGIAGSPPDIPPNATLIFEVELVACRPRKGSSLGSVSDEKARLDHRSGLYVLCICRLYLLLRFEPPVLKMLTADIFQLTGELKKRREVVAAAKEEEKKKREEAKAAAAARIQAKLESKKAHGKGKGLAVSSTILEEHYAKRTGIDPTHILYSSSRGQSILELG